MAENKDRQGTGLKFFCPEAHCLSEEELDSLPEDKRSAVQQTGKDGLWLKVFCQRTVVKSDLAVT